MSVGAKGTGSDWSILVDRWTVIGVALIAFALILALLWLGYDGVRVAGAAVALLSSVVLAAMARPILLAVVMMGRNRAERRDLATRLERLERDHGLRF
jgi:ethanolamine transporter EutH